ncbi:MAG: efflux RND transporter permease subunit, partial [Candidatus Omnitrophica bacterium]|nr:efflux RND transporter permease subunit [Candidatus Omnitrophota bacterium]
FLMDSFGLTINALTLLGIATVLGTLIANAIVIIENVLEHLEHKETALQAAIDGTKEVSGAVLAATGTNLVVFTPIAMMSGIVGQFMRAFGLTVIFATLFSLLSSFSLTPMLCGLLLKKKDIKKKEKRKTINPFAKLAEGVNRAMECLKAEYKKIFDLIFRFPKLTVTFVVLAFLSLALIMPYIGGEFFPDSDEDMITIKITMPQGSTIERTEKTTKIIEERVEKIPELESILTSIGQDGVENSAIVINLISSTKRKRSDTDIIQELIPFTAQIPDAEINIRRGEARGGIEGDISINVYGPDYDKIIEISENMREIMQDSEFFRSVTSSYKTPKKEIRFFPDQEKLIEHGLTAAEIGNTIRASVYGDDSNIYKEGGQEYDINVELDDRYSQDFEDLKQIQIISSKGMFPITELGKIKEAKALPNIRHRDKERFIRLEGYLSKSNSGYVQSILNQEFKKINFPDGYGYGYFGMAEHQRETGREVLKAFILAVILTYMLLAALLNSFTYPIPILLSVGTSFIGVFYALFFLGQDINIASMLGMVMLVGMVVNNSILLIDYTLLKMKEGVEVVEALWLGASRKFRAIIMTSLAIILGVAPQIKSVMPIKPSMSAVVIGGMLASILFTFIFTPVAFWYIERFTKKLFAIFNQENQNKEKS